MKKILSLISIFIGILSVSSFAQDAEQNKLTQLLNQYYNIKNALVTGDVTSAASNAETFIKIANTIDYKVVSEGNIHALLNDATPISTSKDLSKQRKYFSNFSTNMIALAKQQTLTTQAVYVAYCPMKKASWLSNEKEIQNPYYGSAMLECGEVTETINPKK